MKLQTTLENLKAVECRSTWSKGVKEYAFMLLNRVFLNFDDKEITNRQLLRKALLNGAQDWRMFSYGGCSLTYDVDIATLLCNPSELKKYKDGSLPPNKNETWLDVQARALSQAGRLIMECAEF